MRHFHKFLRLLYANKANNRYLCGVLRKILESVWLLSRKSESGKFTTHGITRLNAHVMPWALLVMCRVYQNLDYDKLMSHAFVYTNITGL